jgi:streptogramin lyase
MKTTFTFFLIPILIICNNHLPAQTSYEVYVSSRGTNAVKKYDMNGEYLGDFVASGSGGLTNTEDILFHPDGSTLVTGFGNSSVKQYDGSTGDYLGDFTSGYTLASPSKMSIGPDSLIYVTQWGTTQNKVARFTLDGAFQDEFTSIGAPKGLGHVWDEQKNFYIALFGTGGSGTIHMFDSLGNDLGTFINSTIIQGPTSIWFDGDGSMLVEDWTLGKVFRFDEDGEYLEEFISGMTNPEGIAITPDGELLIGDWGQDAVHLFSSAGESLGYFTTGNGLLDPNSVKIKPVAITGTNEFTEAKASLQVFPTANPGEFNIEFEISNSQHIRITVIDMQGRVIDTPFDRKSGPGFQQIVWKPSAAVDEGMFIIRLQTPGTLFTKRIMVIR